MKSLNKKMARFATAGLILGELLAASLYQTAYYVHFSASNVSVHVSSAAFRFTAFFIAAWLTSWPTMFPTAATRSLVMVGIVAWIVGQIVIVSYTPYSPYIAVESNLSAIQGNYLVLNFVDALLVRLGGGIFFGDALSRLEDNDTGMERWTIFALPFVFLTLVTPVTPVSTDAPPPAFMLVAMTSLACVASSALLSLKEGFRVRKRDKAADPSVWWLLRASIRTATQTYCFLTPFAAMLPFLEQLRVGGAETEFLWPLLALVLGALSAASIAIAAEEESWIVHAGFGVAQPISFGMWLLGHRQAWVSPATLGSVAFFLGFGCTGAFVAMSAVSRDLPSFRFFISWIAAGSALLTVTVKACTNYGAINFDPLLVTSLSLSVVSLVFWPGSHN